MEHGSGPFWAVPVIDIPPVVHFRSVLISEYHCFDRPIQSLPLEIEEIRPYNSGFQFGCPGSFYRAVNFPVALRYCLEYGPATNVELAIGIIATLADDDG